MRTFWTSLAAGLVIGLPWQLTAQAQTPDETITIIREAATAQGVSGDWLIAVARCETGGTFNPFAVGDGGSSFGVLQLHRGGLLDQGPSSFYALGYTDPFNVWQAADYSARMFALGLSSAWTCARGR